MTIHFGLRLLVLNVPFLSLQKIIEVLSSLVMKREGERELDQPPPKIIVQAYDTPQPQAGTFQPLVVPRDSKDTTATTQQNICSQDQSSVYVESDHVHVFTPQVLFSSSLGQEPNVSMSSSRPQQLPSSSKTQTIYSGVSQTANLHQQHADVKAKSKKQKASVTPNQPLKTSCTHVKTQAPTEVHRHTQHTISPQTPKQAQAWSKTHGVHPKQQSQAMASGPFRVPAQSEVYSKAQAMAWSRMDKAKQRLKEHIEEVITIFSSSVISVEQAKRKQVCFLYMILVVLTYL